MRFPRLRTPRAWRRARRTLVGLIAAALVLVLIGQAPAGASLFGTVLVCLVILESAQLRTLLVEGQQQQYALTQIQPLLGQLPLELGGWAADSILIHNAVRLMVDARPRLVLECGSGSSTVVFARCLQVLGGRIISLEHDPSYARHSSELVRLYGLDDVATVVTAPLITREVEGKKAVWYEAEYESFLSTPIDILIIDGPPKASASRARYPAVPLLKPWLASECWILMDDGDRSDERAIAQAWSDDLGAKLTYVEGGRGGWLLHRQAPAAPVGRANH